MSPVVRTAASARTPRLEEATRARILAAASDWFADHGYAATSMRDLAGATGITPGALYVHFASKGQLLLSVYEEGVSRIGAAVDAALAAAPAAPWDRLEAAAEAHLEILLGRAGFARVLVRVLPDDVPEVARGLRKLRDAYEQRFVALFAALPVKPGTDVRLMRLLLLGALNATQAWAKPGAGRATPKSIAQHYVSALRAGLAPDAPRSRSAASRSGDTA